MAVTKNMDMLIAHVKTYAQKKSANQLRAGLDIDPSKIADDAYVTEKVREYCEAVITTDALYDDCMGRTAIPKITEFVGLHPKTAVDALQPKRDAAKAAVDGLDLAAVQAKAGTALDGAESADLTTWLADAKTAVKGKIDAKTFDGDVDTHDYAKELANEVVAKYNAKVAADAALQAKRDAAKAAVDGLDLAAVQAKAGTALDGAESADLTTWLADAKTAVKGKIDAKTFDGDVDTHDYAKELADEVVAKYNAKIAAAEAAMQAKRDTAKAVVGGLDLAAVQAKAGAALNGAEAADLATWLSEAQTTVQGKIDAKAFDSDVDVHDYAKELANEVVAKYNAKKTATAEAELLKKIKVLKDFIDKQFSPFDKKKVKQLFGKGFKQFKLVEEMLNRAAGGGKTVEEVILDHSKRDPRDSSYLSLAGLDELYAAVAEFENKRIDKITVDADKLALGLAASATDEQKKERRDLISEDIVAADSHIDENIDAGELAVLINATDEQLQQRIADNSARRRIKDAYKTLGGNDDATPQFEVGGRSKTVEEMSSEELAQTLATYTDYLARKTDLENRAQAKDIKDKNIKIADFNASTIAADIDQLEKAVLTAELEVLGVTGTAIIPKDGGLPGETETIDISTASPEQLRAAKEAKLESNKLNVDQNALKTKVDGFEVIYFVGADGKATHKKFSELTDDEVALINGKLAPKNKKDKKEPKHNKKSAGTLEKDAEFKSKIVEALETAGANKESAKEFVKTAKFADLVGSVVAVSDEAFKQAIIDGAIAKYTADRRKVLEEMLNIPDGFKFKGTTELKDLGLAAIEDYIAKAIEFKTKLNEGAAAGDKKLEKLNAGDLDQFKSGSATVSKDLGILLAYGFNLTQANRLLSKHKDLIGMSTGTYDRQSVSETISKNTAMLTILGDNVVDTKTWPDGFASEIKAYYKDATKADREQLVDVYKAIVKKETETSIDGAVDKLVLDGTNKRESGKTIAFVDSMFGAELDSLHEKVLLDLIKELEGKTDPESQETKAKYEMLLAAKSYKGAADKTSVARVMRNAIDKYLILSEIRKLSADIKTAVEGTDTEEGLARYQEGAVAIDDTNQVAVKAKLNNLKKMIAAFESKIETLKEVFGIEDSLVDKLEGMVNKDKTKEIEKTIAPQVSTDDEKLEQAALEAQQNLIEADRDGVTSIAFDMDVYNGALTAAAQGNDGRHDGRNMADQVAEMTDTEASTNYIAAYNKKYGKNAYAKIIKGMTNGALDELYERNIFDDEWFESYAEGIAGAIISVLASVRTKETLSEDDKVNYAHIQIVVDVNSRQLYIALAKVLGDERYKQFERLIKREFTGGNVLREREVGGAAASQMVAALEAVLCVGLDTAKETATKEVISKLVGWMKANKLISPYLSARDDDSDNVLDSTKIKELTDLLNTDDCKTDGVLDMIKATAAIATAFKLDEGRSRS